MALASGWRSEGGEPLVWQIRVNSLSSMGSGVALNLALPPPYPGAWRHSLVWRCWGGRGPMLICAGGVPAAPPPPPATATRYARRTQCGRDSAPARRHSSLVARAPLAHPWRTLGAPLAQPWPSPWRPAFSIGALWTFGRKQRRLARAAARFKLEPLGTPGAVFCDAWRGGGGAAGAGGAEPREGHHLARRGAAPRRLSLSWPSCS